MRSFSAQAGGFLSEAGSKVLGVITANLHSGFSVFSSSLTSSKF